MGEVDQESFSGVPNAVLDTNVGLTIYSWHDLLDALKVLLDQDPNATLAHPALEFRRRRARNAFLLALFFYQNEWKALVLAGHLRLAPEPRRQVRISQELAPWALHKYPTPFLSDNRPSGDLQIESVGHEESERKARERDA